MEKLLHPKLPLLEETDSLLAQQERLAALKREVKTLESGLKREVNRAETGGVDDAIGQAQWNKITSLERRQCVATSKHTGERCQRAPIVGGFVCAHHGGAQPLAKAAARQRLLALVEPAIGALCRILQTGPRCQHCGRSDDDKHPAVIKAAQIVLDRTGHHPSVTVEVEQANPFAGLSQDDLIDRLEALLEQAKRQRDLTRLLALPPDQRVLPAKVGDASPEILQTP